MIEGITSIFTTIFGSSEKSINLDTSNRTLLNYLYELEVFELPLGISVMTYIFIILLLNIWMYKKIIRKEDKNKYFSYTFAIKIGLILYTLFLQFAYLTKFATVEMLKHASVERYLSSYFLGELILIVSIFIEYCDRELVKQKIKYIVVTLVILSITPIYSITDATIFFGSYNIQEMLKIYEIEDAATRLKETLPEKSKIYVVHQDGDQDCDLWRLKYFMVPEIDIDITEKINVTLNEKYKRLGRNLKTEWIELLKNNYEYLYIIDTDKLFEKFASDVFISDIESNTLYKINKLQNDNISLEKVEMRGE